MNVCAHGAGLTWRRGGCKVERMKNSILLTAAVLALAPAFAQETAPAAPAAPAQAAAPADAATFEAAARNLMGCIKELNAALQGVKDTGSANAAAPKVKELVARMDAVSAENEKLGQPTPEIQAQVEKAIGAEFEQTMKDLGETMRPIAMNGFYDSEALMEALAPVLRMN